MRLDWGIIWAAAVAAALVRVPGLAWPLRPDEAGFTLVARAWEPQSDSMFGPYWVDRSPLLIALVRAADALGGPVVLRVLGALGCALLVVAAAQTARLIAGDRAAAWTAVATAAVTSNPSIDAVAAKGELLGIPLIVSSFWLSLLALRRGSPGWAAGAGLLGGLALGLKQNLVAGLVFGAVLLLGSWLTGRVGRADFLRLAGGALLGAAAPVAATVVWAMSAGVHLSTLWYAVYGFRSDALDVILRTSSAANEERARELLIVAFAGGIAWIIGGFLVHLRSEWESDRTLTLATLAVVLVDGLGLVLGGSYWRQYLFGLVPATALCAAVLTARASRRGVAMRTLIVAAAVISVVSWVGWLTQNLDGSKSADEYYTGEAVGAAARPGDTLVVYGGRADIQYASGLPSPYQHLWSLPMRTLDPDLAQLTALVESPDRPTWLVEWADFDAWDSPGAATLRAAVQERYVLHGLGCRDRPVYLRRDATRPPLELDCDRPW